MAAHRARATSAAALPPEVAKRRVARMSDDGAYLSVDCACAAPALPASATSGSCPPPPDVGRPAAGRRREIMSSVT